MAVPLTKVEREKLLEWAEEIWDEGTEEPAVMGHALEIMRYEETISDMEDRLRGARIARG